MLDTVEAVQLRHSRDTPARHKAALGQFFTPVSIARFMASLFEPAAARARLLDAGAGVGTLSVAFAEACATLGIGRLQIDAHERDPAVHDALARHLSAASAHVRRQFSITAGDFVETAVNRIQFGAAPRYTHAIPTIGIVLRKRNSQAFRSRWNVLRNCLSVGTGFADSWIREAIRLQGGASNLSLKRLARVGIVFPIMIILVLYATFSRP